MYVQGHNGEIEILIVQDRLLYFTHHASPASVSPRPHLLMEYDPPMYQGVGACTVWIVCNDWP